MNKSRFFLLCLELQTKTGTQGVIEALRRRGGGLLHHDAPIWGDEREREGVGEREREKKEKDREREKEMVREKGKESSS